MIIPKHRYDEIFEIEVDGWCYAIARFEGEISPSIVHRLLKEFAPSLQRSVECHYAFDPLAVARRISKSAKYLISEKEVLFCLLTHLPRPDGLNEEAQYVLAMIVDQAERVYAGVLPRLEKKWKGERLEAERRKAAETQPTLPPTPASTPRPEFFKAPSTRATATKPWVAQGY